jgi:hypothetical protein
MPLLFAEEPDEPNHRRSTVVAIGNADHGDQ